MHQVCANLHTNILGAVAHLFFPSCIISFSICQHRNIWQAHGSILFPLFTVKSLSRTITMVPYRITSKACFSLLLHHEAVTCVSETRATYGICRVERNSIGANKRLGSFFLFDCKVSSLYLGASGQAYNGFGHGWDSNRLYFWYVSVRHRFVRVLNISAFIMTRPEMATHYSGSSSFRQHNHAYHWQQMRSTHDQLFPRIMRPRKTGHLLAVCCPCAVIGWFVSSTTIAPKFPYNPVHVVFGSSSTGISNLRKSSAVTLFRANLIESACLVDVSRASFPGMTLAPSIHGTKVPLLTW